MKNDLTLKDLAIREDIARRFMRPYGHTKNQLTEFIRTWHAELCQAARDNHLLTVLAGTPLEYLELYIREPLLTGLGPRWCVSAALVTLRGIPRCLLDDDEIQLLNNERFNDLINEALARQFAHHPLSSSPEAV